MSWGPERSIGSLVMLVGLLVIVLNAITPAHLLSIGLIGIAVTFVGGVVFVAGPRARSDK